MLFQPSMYRLVLHLFTLLLTTGALLACAGTKAGLSEQGPAKEPSIAVAEPMEVDDRLRAYRHMALASLYEGEGEYEKARDHLARAIENDPESAYLNTRMAVLLKALKDYPEAVTYAQRAVALDPGRLESRLVLADLYILLKDDEAAMKEYREALAIDPGQKRVRLILATLFIQKKQYEEAKRELAVLIREDPDLVIAHYYLGRINFEQGNHGEAEKAYRRALQINEAMEHALFDLGTLYQMNKEDAKAADIYRRLLSFYPNNITVRERLIHLYYKLGEEKQAEREMEEIRKKSKPGDPGRQSLGLIYLRHGKLDESIAELDLIVRAWPDDDKSRYYLATAYEEKEDHEKALEHFGQIPEDSEFYANAMIHAAYIFETQGKYDEAVDILEKALAVDKEKIDLYLMLASVFESKKDYDKALEVIDRGLELDEKSEELIFRKGVILDKKGEKEQCLVQMKSILEINPGHADALNYIGYTYAEQGIRLDEAKAMIEKALESKPDSGYIIDSLGWVYFQKGRYDEALKYLEKASSLVPNDPTILEHLGDVYFKKGMYRESLKTYEKSLTLNHPQEEKVRKKIEEVKRLLP